MFLYANKNNMVLLYCFQSLTTYYYFSFLFTKNLFNESLLLILQM